MFSSDSSPLRPPSSPRSSHFQKPFSMSPLNAEFCSPSSGMNLNLKFPTVEGFPTPDIPSSAFKSPPTSVIRSPSYGIRNRLFRLPNDEDRSILETPKVTPRKIDNIINGRSTIPPSEPLNTLSKILPVLCFVSFFFLFAFPPFAFVFCIALIAHFVVKYRIKKEGDARLAARVPKISFPRSPSRF
ncbi:hypothetical protein TRFO_26404 [Tritrichomonas foetus]|uniref:Uncharacterized protein n=1 Tax=Tritrichomonas foetus TaxID=1144522 RepID=A0A1J4K8N7_9EUKA|nr:hypothetical protein TRFO_26404 [Tritrichomonas foetus]|eukprot:OHT05797.1 hypothetical protein TRFO_26404 [Tritrichomonas foetus]